MTHKNSSYAQNNTTKHRYQDFISGLISNTLNVANMYLNINMLKNRCITKNTKIQAHTHTHTYKNIQTHRVRNRKDIKDTPYQTYYGTNPSKGRLS